MTHSMCSERGLKALLQKPQLGGGAQSLEVALEPCWCGIDTGLLVTR